MAHWIELKTEAGRISADQRVFLADADTAGCRTHVVRSVQQLAGVVLVVLQDPVLQSGAAIRKHRLDGAGFDRDLPLNRFPLFDH